MREKKITFMTKQLVKKTLLHTTYSMDCQKRCIWLFLTTIWLSLTAVVCNILSVLVVNATPSRIWYRQDCTKTAISGAKYDNFDSGPSCTSKAVYTFQYSHTVQMIHTYAKKIDDNQSKCFYCLLASQERIVFVYCMQYPYPI